MWKIALAGAMLAATGASLSFAQIIETETTAVTQTASGPVVTEGQIASLKSVLKLKPEQQRHWPAVASALRNLAHRQNRAQADSATGWRQRVASAAFDANAIRRVASAAAPLIGSLDDRQKQEGMRLVHSLGFGSLASAF